jgi:hypothetical protein
MPMPRLLTIAHLPVSRESPSNEFLWLVDAAPEFSQAVRIQSPYERKRPGS